VQKDFHDSSCFCGGLTRRSAPPSRFVSSGAMTALTLSPIATTDWLTRPGAIPNGIARRTPGLTYSATPGPGSRLAPTPTGLRLTAQR
jgi:hypothetical protein